MLGSEGAGRGVCLGDWLGRRHRAGWAGRAPAGGSAAPWRPEPAGCRAGGCGPGHTWASRLYPEGDRKPPTHLLKIPSVGITSTHTTPGPGTREPPEPQAQAERSPDRAGVQGRLEGAPGTPGLREQRPRLWGAGASGRSAPASGAAPPPQGSRGLPEQRPRLGSSTPASGEPGPPGAAPPPREQRPHLGSRALACERSFFCDSCRAARTGASSSSSPSCSLSALGLSACSLISFELSTSNVSESSSLASMSRGRSPSAKQAGGSRGGP